MFSGEKRTVVDGPFTEAKELIAGFWLWQVRSMDEAIEWVKRMPNPPGVDAEIEIRQVGEAGGLRGRRYARAQSAGGAHPGRSGAQSGRRRQEGIAGKSQRSGRT